MHYDMNGASTGDLSINGRTVSELLWYLQSKCGSDTSS